jgi:heme/copper-type cytochrome/quinol oxidase subunit 3
VYGLIVTIVLAILFTALQVLEYIEAPFTIADSVYGSCFFLATGFHGFHVFVGTIFLTVCLGRQLSFHFTKKHHFGLIANIEFVWLCANSCL